MTPQERADILARHQPIGVRLHDGTYDDDDRECAADGDDWPCDAYRLGHDVDDRARDLTVRALHRWRHPSFAIGDRSCRCVADALTALEMSREHVR